MTVSQPAITRRLSTWPERTFAHDVPTNVSVEPLSVQPLFASFGTTTLSKYTLTSEGSDGGGESGKTHDAVIFAAICESCASSAVASAVATL